MTARSIPRIMLALGLGLLAFAGFFSTADPMEINPGLPYLPPESLHFHFASSAFPIRPFILRRLPESGKFGEYLAGGGTEIPVRFLVLTPLSDASTDSGAKSLRLLGFSAEGAEDSPHFLGTDQYGRDIWSRLLYGGRTTVAIGLAAAAGATLLALLVGVAAGLLGGWGDTILMRVVDVVLSVPWFYLLLALRAMLPLRTAPLAAVAVSTALLAAVGWARPARLLRGATLEAKQQAYVRLAAANGAGLWHRVRWHLLPAVSPLAVTQFTILLPQFMASEVALSYFGLGVDDPFVSWGSMLAATQQLSSLVDHPWILAPIWAMLPLFLSLHRVSDAGIPTTLTIPVATRHKGGLLQK